MEVIFYAIIILLLIVVAFFVFQNLHKNKKILSLQDELIDTDNETKKIYNQYIEIKSKYDSEIGKNEQFKDILKNEFTILSKQLLEENSQKLTKDSVNSVANVVNPFKEQLEGFKNAISVHYQKESNEKVELKTLLQSEINNLINSTKTTALATENLAKAFSSDKKMQGNWGEIQLERLLEISGLQKGIDFFTQEFFKNEDNERRFLDVLVKMPEGNEIIIDSKLSLVNYQNYINTETPEKEIFLKAFLKDIKNNIDNLSAKDYSQFIIKKNIDFVIMFVPIESSFILALEKDSTLQEYAWGKRIILASNTNLFAVLRCVYLILKQDKQSKNAEAIAIAGANMYDKFALFLIDLEKIGDNIKTISGTYTKLINHVKEGRGNLLDRAEKMKELGVKPNKKTPESFKNTLDKSNDIDQANKQNLLE
jgi:DNA recombination protein RmuC